MESKRSDILNVAREILADAGLKGLSTADIAKEAVRRCQNMNLPEDQFKAKLGPRLAANLKLKKEKPTFAAVNWEAGPRKGKPRQGWYRLKRERSVALERTITPPSAGKAFVGAAGEFAVMSELLFFEYNPSKTAVDDGIDIIASKDNKYFHIQVKTAVEQEGGRFTYSIKLNSFRQHDTGSMYYVFVLRRGIKNEFIIVPSNFIRALITKCKTTNASTYSVTIAAVGKAQYRLNDIDVTHLYGNFASIA